MKGGAEAQKGRQRRPRVGGHQEASGRTHIIWGVGQWPQTPITSRLLTSLGRTRGVVFTHTQRRSSSPPSRSAGGWVGERAVEERMVTP